MQAERERRGEIKHRFTLVNSSSIKKESLKAGREPVLINVQSKWNSCTTPPNDTHTHAHTHTHTHTYARVISMLCDCGEFQWANKIDLNEIDVIYSWSCLKVKLMKRKNKICIMSWNCKQSEHSKDGHIDQSQMRKSSKLLAMSIKQTSYLKAWECSLSTYRTNTLVLFYSFVNRKTYFFNWYNSSV